MNAGRVIESMVKLDDYRAQAELCARCHKEVDVTTAIYGRYAEAFFSKTKVDIRHLVVNNQVIIIPMVTEKRFPKLRKGYFCRECYTDLWAVTYRDKSGHLRHGIDVLHSKPGPVVQPKNDDHEASPIIKGLYAPHAGSKIHRKKAHYHESDESAVKGSSSNRAVIHQDREHLVKTDRLKGFNRPARHPSYKSSTVRHLVHKGKPTKAGVKRGVK